VVPSRLISGRLLNFFAGVLTEGPAVCQEQTKALRARFTVGLRLTWSGDSEILFPARLICLISIGAKDDAGHRESQG
jgi:hypothetical protein